MAHTPGPWHIHWGEKYPYIKDSNGNYVLDHNPTAGTLRHADDARLIAAAPDMLEALKKVRDELVPKGYGYGFIDAAIAKATGGA